MSYERHFMDNTKTTSHLSLSNKRFRVFIEERSDGVYETDIHGNFIYFNNALCKVFGYPKEEIQWKNYASFMDKKHEFARLCPIPHGCF